MSTYFTSSSYAVENPESIAAGDFNGDNNLDLATTTRTANGIGVAILLGDGTGKFAAAKNVSIRQAASTVGSLAVGDFNRDGKLDLVIASAPDSATNSAAISLLLGNGAGEFAAPSNYSVTGFFTQIAIPADFNLDGNLDALSSSVLLGDGIGQLRPGAAVPTVGGKVFPSGNPSIATGDINSDGKLDVLQLNEVYIFGLNSGFINILLGDGAGGFTNQQSFQDTNSYSGAIVTADVNRDGNLDMIMTSDGNGDGLVRGDVLLGNGKGQFQAGQSFATTGDSIAFADFNGDGKLDFASSAANGKTSITLGDGTGRFGKPTLVYQSKSGSAGVTPLVIGDFNRDGKPDLATADGAANTVSVHLNQANGTDAITLSNFAGRKSINISGVLNQSANIDFTKGTLRLGTLRSNVKGYIDAIGTANKDIIRGNSRNNNLDGDMGNDRLIGSGGNDTLTGDAGNDILIGGTGKDRFVFKNNVPYETGSSRYELLSLRKIIGVDKITDFSPGVDKIALNSNLIRLRAQASPIFASVESEQQAKRSKALITYVQNIGKIYYNPNRAAPGFGVETGIDGGFTSLAGGLLARVTSGLALSGKDFAQL